MEHNRKLLESKLYENRLKYSEHYFNKPAKNIIFFLGDGSCSVVSYTLIGDRRHGFEHNHGVQDLQRPEELQRTACGARRARLGELPTHRSCKGDNFNQNFVKTS